MKSLFERHCDIRRITNPAPTVLDFAFDIHSNIAMRFKTAYVNDLEVSADHILHSGDIIDIETSEHVHLLDTGWFEKVVTRKAQKQIKNIYNRQNYHVEQSLYRIRKGNRAALRGSIKEAIQEYEKALLYHPQSTWAYNRLGSAYRIQGEYEKSMSAHRQALVINPESAYALSGLGITLYVQGIMDDAEAYLRRADKLQPSRANSVFGLARVYLLNQFYDRVETLCRRLIDIEPKHARGYLYLSMSYALQGKGADAFRTLEYAVKHFYKELEYNHALAIGTHTCYHYALSLVFANSSNTTRLFDQAVTICTASGLIRELLQDAHCIQDAMLAQYCPPQSLLRVHYIQGIQEKYRHYSARLASMIR